MKAAQSGDVIELLDDCTSGGMDLTKSITIKGAHSITFAGKGIALRGAALTFDGAPFVMTGIGATGNAELGWMTIALGSGSSLNLSGASRRSTAAALRATFTPSTAPATTPSTSQALP